MDTASWQQRARPWLDRLRRELTPRQVRPLRVRLWLLQPASWSPDGLHLDAALSHVAVRAAAGMDPGDVFHGYRGPPPHLQLPLEEVERAGHRLWACSWAQPSPGAVEGVRYWRKRADVERYGLNPTAKVITAGGAYKSLNTPRGIMTTPYLDTYLRGDPDLLARMVRHLDRLGRSGLGAVLGAEIDDDPLDRSMVHLGAPQRSIPVRDADEASAYADGSYSLRLATVRPPYWHHASETLCVVPTLGGAP
jgi:CRISPR type IV-associated protein Csf3